MASFALHASRKRPRTGKSPVRGKIRTPCIRNELALARYTRHASEKPRKPPSEDTPREDLARKGPFSLHGPLESCTARRSCHPASANHPSARNPCTAHAPPAAPKRNSGANRAVTIPRPASTAAPGIAVASECAVPLEGAARVAGRQPRRLPAAPNRPRAPRANQQQPSAGLRFVPSKARTHHTYLSAAPVAGFSS